MILIHAIIISLATASSIGANKFLFSCLHLLINFDCLFNKVPL